MKYTRTFKIGLGTVAALSFLVAFFNFMDGNFTSMLWSLSYGVFGIGLALAYDSRISPSDENDKNTRKVSPAERYTTILALVLGGTACLVWYVTRFIEIL